jgi:hypothetical protein
MWEDRGGDGWNEAATDYVIPNPRNELGHENHTNVTNISIDDCLIVLPAWCNILLSVPCCYINNLENTHTSLQFWHITIVCDTRRKNKVLHFFYVFSSNFGNLLKVRMSLYSNRKFPAAWSTKHSSFGRRAVSKHTTGVIIIEMIDILWVVCYKY